jgi:Reverse transcriptase (RNA-dependent DNA polymerase)
MPSENLAVPSVEPNLLLNDPSTSPEQPQRDTVGFVDGPRARRLSATFGERNILPEGSKRARVSTRRQAHAAALASTHDLHAFHAAFSTGISRPLMTKMHGQHRDTLPTEPCSWRQMLKHRFAAEFELAAEREIQELEKRETYEWISESSVNTIPLPLLWVFKYKFDTDGYLTKFKARLCVRGDLQSTEQDTYAATLAARTFRALMAIAAAFDLEIRQYDAVHAFINSKLNEEIHCRAQKGLSEAELAGAS